MKRDWIYGLLICGCYAIAIFFAISAVAMSFYTHNPNHGLIATNHAIFSVGLVVLGKLLSLMSVAQQALDIYVERHSPRERLDHDLERRL